MLSYQHEYHAGNHADVLKHVAWSLVIQALQRKPGPIRLFDAHAGSGLYDLGSREARLNAEHETGVARLFRRPGLPHGLGPWQAVLEAANPGARLRRYPGSPLLAQSMLRDDDHLVLLELHPGAHRALRRAMGRAPHVHIHRRDCHEGLPALLPPPERRGAVLVDPAYEQRGDYDRVVSLLTDCCRRWPTGTYVIWYPFIRDRAAERFPSRVAATGIRKVLRIELQVSSDGAEGMRGSGLLLVNPPYGVEPQFQALMPVLWRVLANDGAGHAACNWLVPE